MKVRYEIMTDKWAAVEWPANVPIPNAGDSVIMQIDANNTHAFEVTGRFYSMGIDPRDGQPETIVMIQGKSMKGAPPTPPSGAQTP